MTRSLGIHSGSLSTFLAYTNYRACIAAYWRFVDHYNGDNPNDLDHAQIWSSDYYYDFAVTEDERTQFAEAGWYPYAFLSSLKRWTRF